MSVSDPHLLLSAYQCGPGMGSVSQIGWHWYKRLVDLMPVTLVTHVRNRPALEAAGAPLGRSRVIYIDTEWFAGPLYRCASSVFPKSEHAVFLVSSLDFYVYDFTMVRQLREVACEWDIVHAVTPVSPLAATRLHKLGRPVVLGPWNGGLASPESFRQIMRDDSGWLYPARNLGRVFDWWTGSSRGASVLLSATAATRAAISRRYQNKVVPMLENAVDLGVFSGSPWPTAPATGNPLKLSFVGRLVPFKGIGMLLQAIARLKSDVPIELEIVGDGPMREELEAEARRLGVEGVVRFLGQLPPGEVADAVRRSHLFCLPSVRESGGAVVLEAMAAARPVVVVEHGGPAEIVDSEIGVALPPAGEAQVVSGLMRTFSDVFENPAAWAKRGAKGRERAERRFSWDAKVRDAAHLYRRLHRGEMPAQVALIGSR